jgi:hypothetical protein
VHVPTPFGQGPRRVPPAEAPERPPMARKHLVLIHGRSTKPPAAEKWRLVRAALLHGLERVDARAARALADGAVRASFAYYGDLNNRLMVAAEPWRKKKMVLRGGTWYEPPRSYDADLRRLFDRPNSRLGPADYAELLQRERDLRGADDLARVVSPLLALLGLSGPILRKVLPDLGAYLGSRVVGSAVRQRLQAPLARALRAGDDVALVAHSMGCIVSYDVLWKFSRMSEYAALRSKKISLWLTLGCPLGDPAVRGSLYDSREPEDGAFPANVRDWINVAARDDFVAHDGTIADDFGAMKERRLVRRLADRPRICNFWTGWEGSNPHKFYGYLDHPAVARDIAAWMRG